MTTRTPFICGNWKMHKTIGEALALVDALLPRLAGRAGVEVAVAPPFTALHAVGKRLHGTSVGLCAQDVHFESWGAYTGAVAGEMLRDVGCRYAIVGHSERRQLFGETDDATGRKVRTLLGKGLRPILCVGETLDERRAGKTTDVVLRQLRAGLSGIEPAAADELVVAYEPVWAIGTGLNATAAQAQHVHANIRAELRALFADDAAAARVRIQYGGSVKPDNAADLLFGPDVDGALVGGASLQADAFAGIVAAAQAAKTHGERVR